AAAQAAISRNTVVGITGTTTPTSPMITNDMAISRQRNTRIGGHSHLAGPSITAAWRRREAPFPSFRLPCHPARSAAVRHPAAARRYVILRAVAGSAQSQYAGSRGG